MTTRSELMSHRDGSESRASAIGLAKASPAIAVLFTRSASTAARKAAAAKLLPGSVTIDPPQERAEKDESDPVECIRGAAGRCTGPGRTIRFCTSEIPPDSG